MYHNCRKCLFSRLLKNTVQLGVVVHACDSSPWEGEPGGLSAGDWHMLHSNTFSGGGGGRNGEER